jgi:heterodisulfide reductase subunit B2
MTIGFYPGCSLEGSSREYNESVVALARALDIELKEADDWNCCGATAAHNMNRELSLSLPARIMALAEKEGLEEMLVPCAACYNRLLSVQFELKADQKLAARIGEIIEKPYKGTLRLMSVLQFVEKYVVPKLEGRIVNPFAKKVACYYGCLLVRPYQILKPARVEDPLTMDVIMKQLGADSIDWAFKTECCGAGLTVSRTDIVAKLSGNILDDAVARGAEAMVVACPMCHSNLDMRRKDIVSYVKHSIDIPVLYITQAIGLAIGLSAKELGLQRHFVPVTFDLKPVEQ